VTFQRKPQPIPTDPTEQQQWARALAKGCIIPELLLQRSSHLPPQGRIATVYPRGIEAGAALMFQRVANGGIPIPRRLLDSALRSSWSRGLAAAAALPPKAAFSRRRSSVITIYRAGIERGILLTLEAFKLRDRGGSS